MDTNRALYHILSTTIRSFTSRFRYSCFVLKTSIRVIRAKKYLGNAPKNKKTKNPSRPSRLSGSKQNKPPATLKTPSTPRRTKLAILHPNPKAFPFPDRIPPLSGKNPKPLRALRAFAVQLPAFTARYAQDAKHIRIAVRNHGYKGTEVAKVLSMSPPSVSRLVENGEIILDDQKDVAVKITNMEI